MATESVTQSYDVRFFFDSDDLTNRRPGTWKYAMLGHMRAMWTIAERDDKLDKMGAKLRHAVMVDQMSTNWVQRAKQLY